MPLHIKLVTTQQQAQGFYLVQNRAVPQEVYETHVSVPRVGGSAWFENNRKFWLDRDVGTLLQVRLDLVEPKPFHSDVDKAFSDLDAAETSFNKWKLLAGDSAEAAVELDHATGDTIRFRVLLSYG